MLEHLTHYFNQAIVGYDLGLTGGIFLRQGKKERLFVTEVVKDCAAGLARCLF